MTRPIPPEVNEIIRQIPNWANAKDLQIEPLEGLTNSNYSVKVANERFVLRVSGKNAARLCINRELEILCAKIDPRQFLSRNRRRK